MSEFKYTIQDIFSFDVGTKFEDIEGNRYKIFKEKEHHCKTLKYYIFNENLLNTKFKKL